METLRRWRREGAGEAELEQAFPCVRVNYWLYSSLSLSLSKEIFKLHSAGYQGLRWGDVCELINCQLTFNDVQLCSINSGLGNVSPNTPKTTCPPLPVSYPLPFLPAVDSSLQHLKDEVNISKFKKKLIGCWNNSQSEINTFNLNIWNVTIVGTCLCDFAQKELHMVSNGNICKPLVETSLDGL